MLNHLLTRIYAKISIVTDNTPLSDDERLRLEHYTVFLAAGIPIMMVFSTFHLLCGDYPQGGAVAACGIGLIVGWGLIRRGLRAVTIYRINGVLFAGLLIYLAALGGQDGSKILWTYTFPLIAFFLLGRSEGWFWVVVLYSLLAGILILKESPIPLHTYSAEFRTRFLISFAIVSIVAFWFEYFREENRRRAENERQQLEKALEEVKALSGLLPICSACKKIRDDQGYWNQIETYIHQHSEARFSHGICPECMAELYPEAQALSESASDPDTDRPGEI